MWGVVLVDVVRRVPSSQNPRSRKPRFDLAASLAAQRAAIRDLYLPEVSAGVQPRHGKIPDKARIGTGFFRVVRAGFPGTRLKKPLSRQRTGSDRIRKSLECCSQIRQSPRSISVHYAHGVTGKHKLIMGAQNKVAISNQKRSPITDDLSSILYRAFRILSRHLFANNLGLPVIHASGTFYYPGLSTSNCRRRF